MCVSTQPDPKLSDERGDIRGKLSCGGDTILEAGGGGNSFRGVVSDPRASLRENIDGFSKRKHGGIPEGRISSRASYFIHQNRVRLRRRRQDHNGIFIGVRKIGYIGDQTGLFQRIGHRKQWNFLCNLVLHVLVWKPNGYVPWRSRWHRFRRRSLHCRRWIVSFFFFPHQFFFFKLKNTKSSHIDT